MRSQAAADEVADFRDHQSRHEQRPRVHSQQFEAGSVVAIVGVYIGVERPGVDDQGDDFASWMSISSTRSDILRLPLRPAAAALS